MEQGLRNIAVLLKYWNYLAMFISPIKKLLPLITTVIIYGNAQLPFEPRDFL